MFKKILLAVLLLVLLAGVSYVKIMRDEARTDNLYRQGYQKGQETAQAGQADSDSAAEVLAVQMQGALEDSLWALRAQYQAELDSLTSVVGAKNGRIAWLQKELSAARNQPAASQVTATRADNSDRHKEIVQYYKASIKDLPSDLTEYERRIALSEIRTETAQKYAITVAQLNDIRKDYNLED
ncbi:MAG: hypothetical protein KKA42_12755 [candidate division Zixibacteria bacterium]|nr:hypothetical protein [candidate division Zixibacteria bacterium]